MKIIIAGGTGLVGQILVPELLQHEYDIYVLGRNEEKIKLTFQETVHASTWDKLNTLDPSEFDAIINLAGKSIADSRWSTKVKNSLLSSRVATTNQLINWGLNAKNKKPHLYNASAVSIYGLQKKIAQDNVIFSETSTPINSLEPNFSSQLVTQWEQSATNGMSMGMPVTLMRFGVVLKRGKGMLKKLELPAKYGMGAVLGSGEQPLSWIDSTDLIDAIVFLLKHSEITGPVNLVAPEHISQRTFTRTLAKVLKKPALLHLHEWTVRVLFGQMGEELLLSGQTVAPQRLLEYQFNFKYPTLFTSLTKEFGS